MSEQKAILIVDDEWMLVETIAYHLEKAGYIVHKAMDGESGFKQALGIKPHMIILDVMLPQMSGWQVCRELRQSPDFPQGVPILMMSARGQTEDRFKALEAGANDFLAKPFGMQDLLAQVKTLLG